MTILANNTARADDFINESERDGTPANDLGRVPKLENDGYLSPSFIRNVSARVTNSSFTERVLRFDTEDFDNGGLFDDTGESLEYNGTGSTSQVNGGGFDGLPSNANEKMAQEFTTGSGGMASKVIFSADYIGGTGSGDGVSISIQADDGSGKPSGVDLTESETVTVTSSSPTNYTAYFNTPVYLEPSTTYHLVGNWKSGDEVRFNGNNSSGTGYSYSLDGGSNWTDVASKSLNMNLYVDTTSYFTAPSDGIYLVNANLIPRWNNSSSESGFIYLYVNDVKKVQQTSYKDSNNATHDTGVCISTILSLSSGDIVSLSTPDDVQINENSTFEIIRLR